MRHLHLAFPVFGRYIPPYCKVKRELNREKKMKVTIGLNIDNSNKAGFADALLNQFGEACPSLAVGGLTMAYQAEINESQLENLQHAVAGINKYHAPDAPPILHLAVVPEAP